MADFTVEMGTPILWGSSSYSSTLSGITLTNDITLKGVASAAARQGERVDLGANRAGGYSVQVCIEMDADPVAGAPISVYWSSSYSGTAATGNDGGAAITGLDAAWAPTTIDEWKQQLMLIGILPLTSDNKTPNVKTINGYFSPPTRYGQIVIVNGGGQKLNDTDDIEMYVAMIPITDDAA